jgi:hypothetical protein
VGRFDGVFRKTLKMAMGQDVSQCGI